jgi:hypothetical protein
MLACIACVNKEEGGGGGRERDGGDTPTCRDPVKSLTSQVRTTLLDLLLFCLLLPASCLVCMSY